MHSLRWSTTDEQPLQASKWLKLSALIDVEEMEQLFAALPPFELFRCGVIGKNPPESLAQDFFLKQYHAYVDSLKQGLLPNPASYRSWFSSILTISREALYAIPIGENHHLLRIAKPVIQMQAHHIDYSPFDKKFRSGILGPESIPWGIQFSYPQLYQDNLSKKVESIHKSSAFPNTALFHHLQKWLRQYTIPTPFLVEDVRYNVPIRLGKACLSWINCHPQFLSKGISVA